MTTFQALEQAKNWLTQHDLAVATGLPEREVREQIQALRRGGHIIISSPHNDNRGYRLITQASSWEDVGEMQKFFLRWEGQLKDQFYTLRVMKDKARELFGRQPDMFAQEVKR